LKRFPFDVVVFDLDGTLLNTAPDLTTAVNHMLSEIGRAQLSQEAVTRMIGGGMRLLMERALTATGAVTSDLVNQALPMFLDYYEKHLAAKTRPYSGANKALDDLRARGAKLAICSNKPEHLTRKLLQAFAWNDHFAAVVGGDTLKARKPDPSVFWETIRRAGGGRGVLVGDSITDVETAHAAGMPSLIMSFGYRDRPAEELGATRVVTTFDQLVSTLLEL
jgi:phosphoglycolate phosphatase